MRDRSGKDVQPVDPDKPGAVTRSGFLRGSLAVVAVGGVGSLLAACSSSSSAADTPKNGGTYYIVAAVGPNTTSFMAVNRNGALQAGKDLGIDVIFTYPQPPDESQQISLLKAAIATRPAGIALDLYSPAATSPLIEQMISEGISVALWNLQATTGATAVEQGLAYVGQDELKSGGVLAAHLATYLKPGSTVLFVHAFQGFPSTVRGSGAYTTLQQAGFKVAPSLFSGLDIPTGQGVVEAYVARHPEIDAFIANDDVAAQAVARYLVSAGKQKAGIPFASFDLTEPTIPYLENGLLTFILSQQPFTQGYLSILNLFLATEYGQNPVNINTGTLIVDSHNLGKLKTLVKEGRGG